MARDVNEVLEHAIRGGLETKPAERRIFLSTILERVYLALTISQVRAQSTYQEVEQKMKNKSNLHLYFNGSLSYSDYAEYLKLATIHGVMYTIVSPTGQTPFGLVLADKDTAVFADNLYVEDELHLRDIESY